MIRKKRILWLDDDFEQGPERLQEWVKALDAYQEKLDVVKTGRLVDFAAELKAAHQAQPQDNTYIDAIFLDVMLRIPRSDATLEPLGFANTKWLALEVGAQILGVMQNPTSQDKRPNWLRPYEERRTLLFTSHTTIQNRWAQHVDADVREASWVRVITKELIPSDGDSPFLQVVQEILGSNA
jgi:hypothetical protein